MKWLKSLLNPGSSEQKTSSRKEDAQKAAQYVGENFGRALERLADR
jgi:hypothetical protein